MYHLDFPWYYYIHNPGLLWKGLLTGKPYTLWHCIATVVYVWLWGHTGACFNIKMSYQHMNSIRQSWDYMIILRRFYVFIFYLVLQARFTFTGAIVWHVRMIHGLYCRLCTSFDYFQCIPYSKVNELYMICRSSYCSHIMWLEIWHSCALIHWGQDKIAAISQMTFSNEWKCVNFAKYFTEVCS